MQEPFAKIEPMGRKVNLKRRTAGDFVERLKRDSARLSHSSVQMQEVHMAEEFLKGLPELSYHVTKINHWGKHQPRLVRLTSEGVENIRMNVVSSMHTYGEVLSVALRNLNTFFIQYLHADHDYVYQSPIAVQIVHEISTRVALCRSTDKKRVSMERAFELIKQSSRRGSSERPASLPIPTNTVSHHASLTLPEKAFSSTSAIVSNSPGTRTSILSTSSSPDEASRRAERKERLKEKRAAKLTKVLGTSQDTRLHAEIDRLLWNEATSEGKAISQFITDFYVIMKSPATCLSNLRKFLDSMRSHIIQEKGAALVKLAVNISEEGEEGASTTSSVMSSIIEKCLEQAVFGRLHKQIMATLATLCKISDEHLSTITAAIRGRTQYFFGVPGDLESISGWSTTRAELAVLSQSDTPSAKLSIIVSAAKSIFSTANYEQTVLKRKSFVLSADDFLPIFMYAVVHSELSGLESINQFLWQLCDPTQLTGEAGYYLTVFSSIVSLLHRISLPSLHSAQSMDDVVLEEDGVDEDKEDVEKKSSWHSRVQFWK